MNNTLNIAHRGASSLVTENTINSFERALEIGCDGIEFDVHLSSDGELIIFHDKNLIRMTGGRREELIGDLTLSEIRNIILVNDEKIPTFDEFMKYLILKGIKPELQIEVKDQVDERKVVEVLLEKLEKYDYIKDVYISSFTPKYLKKVNEMNKNIKTIFLSRECKNYTDVESILSEVGAVGVHFLIQDVELACVDHFKNLNYLVGAWKLKADKEMMKKSHELKLFRATSDDPGLFNDIINS